MMTRSSSCFASLLFSPNRIGVIFVLFFFRGFFETAEGSCEACDSSCLTCDEIKSQCLSCADGYYLESGMCRLNCSLGMYPADDGTCRRCPPHCDVCSDDRTCFRELLAQSADLKDIMFDTGERFVLQIFHPSRVQFPLLDAER